MPPLLPILTYSSRQEYRISWVPRVTMKGCSLNLATKKPLNTPTAAPMPMAIRMTTGMGRVPISGHILLEVVTAWSRDAEIQAVRPTQRPADRSVPVSTIQPAMPRARGR